ncbi:hypothetical protein [Pyxidicoccus sp. MSG2]|uniref:hypothetical protein n=1 Tax=Pyxidicoccus sp. MSG2 TaxID=2996790 RepID=UPI0022715EFE|nr:hypothetical protein [Pyxidicoccus sp. MSG2]MCY1024061.1 hypothetical protein [Pyxidicoccus sp. MSG2]
MLPWALTGRQGRVAGALRAGRASTLRWRARAWSCCSRSSRWERAPVVPRALLLAALPVRSAPAVRPRCAGARVELLLACCSGP